MIALAKNIIKAGYSQDVKDSVLRITKQASKGINNVFEGQCDDVLTLVSIDYCEYEDGGFLEKFHTHAILTFLDKNNQEISIVVETEESWKRGCHWSEDTLLNKSETFSLLTKRN